MAKCKNCKKLDHILNSGVSVGRWCVEKSDSPDIERERICDKFVPMSQGDRIRNMTDEELYQVLLYLNREFLIDGDKLKEWLKSEVGCE